MTAGLRERKKQATRLALHEAALQLVAERGLEHVSVDDVAARAGVSPRTFFNYFPTKDDAVVGLDPRQAGELAEAVRARPASEPPVTAVRAAMLDQAREVAREPQLWPLRLQVVDAHPALTARLSAVFEASERALAAVVAERSGTRTDTDAYPALLAAVQAAVMRTALHRWLASDFTADLPALVDEGWDLVAAGLPAPTA
ncbi:TetR family transcriptional regulator [Modestobacter sp. NPDC049651]|uniref:acyl-CoA-like ligand-binding transcription factor n=1 Tax=unclassified Modestobacter TaxID=2643866 RepID=UPI0033F67A1C